MRLATWNIFYRNRRLEKGLQYLFSWEPDVAALQEVPQKARDFIRGNFPDYQEVSAVDGLNKNPHKITFTCIYTRVKAEKFGEYEYSKLEHNSILTTLYKLSGFPEKHTSVYADISFEGVTIRIQSGRLSTAVGPKKRREFFKSILENRKAEAVNVILGDLNINSGHVFPFLTGLFRAYRPREYFENESFYFHRMLREEKFQNVFKNQSTISYKGIRQQLDFILIPENVTVKDKQVSHHGWGSDHKMLFLEFDPKN